MTTPGRASFAGFQSGRSNPSPSFRDIARRIMVPSDNIKASKELKQALFNATAVLIVVFILIVLYAVNVIIVPHLKTLLLALLFGSFIHPMKRSLSQFFKTTLKEVRLADSPILSGLFLPLSLTDRLMEQFRLSLCRYVYGAFDFFRSVLNGDIKSALAICLAAISLAIIGADSIINFVICIDLITFIKDVTKVGTSFSEAYLNFIMRSFILAQLCWLHPTILVILSLAVTLWIGLSWLFRKVKEKIAEINQQVNQDQESRQELDQELISAQENQNYSVLRQCYRSSLEVYRFIVEQIEDSVETISSACVIAIVAIIVILTTLYLSFQIYVESIYLIEKASTSASAIQSSNPELKSWMPDWINVIHFLLDVAVKNIYQHGREWIRRSTKQLINNAALDGLNETESAKIEKQLVEFWDHAYEMWQKNRTNGTSSLDASSRFSGMNHNWNSLLAALQSLNFGLFAQIFKENWDTMLALTGSLTKLLRENLNLAINLITVTLSLLILWANVLINFVVDLVIFVTALFYLLCASEEEYKPIELLKSLLPRSARTKPSALDPLANRDAFLHIVDESINAVFTASIKMMVFHGLSTWLIHTLFSLEVVYLPSVISAIFAVVPFISPYWASLPACLDLWLSGQVSQAVLLFLLATIPSSFVTTAFYSEIKGAGHPYLTGLAIAAGIFVFGIEGALFGPMLLVSIRLLPLVLVYFLDICK